MTLSCHHRGITRSRAEDLLLDRNEDGCFLVRDSETIANAYTLSVMYQGSVRQYRILPQDGMLYMQTGTGQERRYVDLVQLIHETIQRGNNNGLVCALKHPIPVEPDEEDKDSEDEDYHSRDRSQSITSQYEFFNIPCETGLPQPGQPQPGQPQPGQGVAGQGMPHQIQKQVLQPLHSAPASTNTTKEFADRANVEMISTYFLSRLTTLDLSNHDSDFITKLRDYSDEGVHRDIVDVNSSTGELNEFRKILSHSATELDKHLNIFLSKLDTMRQYFGYAASPVATRKDSSAKEKKPVDLQEMLEKCAQCKQLLSSIEKKAIKTLSELKSKEWDTVDGHGSSKSKSPPTSDLQPRVKTPVIIQPMHYKARLQKHGKPGPKMTLMVDVQNGKFLAVKNSQDSLDDSNTFYHDKIEQVIKCTSNNCRLDMQIEGRKKETYLFEDVWTRENFCQMIQELQTFHASSQEVEHLSIFIGTWNMGAEVPPYSLGSWLKSQGIGRARSRSVGLIPHDLYVIGTQESSLTEKDWVNRIKASLQETLAYDVHDMHTLSVVSMWSLRMVILVRSDYKNKISHVQQSTVKTGIANKLGNKGAIGVSFYFDGTSFCFVNCHLTSGIERNTKRNKNVADIIKGLKFSHPGYSHTGPSDGGTYFMRNQNVHDIIKGLSLGQKSSVFDITNQFHHVFFLGDLNYRMEGIEPQEVIRKVSIERTNGTNAYTPLLALHDQLLKAQNNSEAFFGFHEQDITFPPTYRIGKGTLNEYSWQKVKKTGIRINAPSWCDRVIWKSYPETYIKGTSYGSVEDVKTSDHKPLFSSFDVGIIPQTISSKVTSPQSGGAQILFQSVMAEVKTRTKDNFRIAFYSRCLDGTPESEENEEFVSNKKANYMCPKWTVMQLPKVIPIFDDREYLEDQHILLAVKTADGMESFGECVISLKPMFSSKPEPFECYLTHRGECTGKIKGLMYVKMASQPDVQVKRRRKSYELICLDTDVPRLFTQMSTPPTVTEMKEPLDIDTSQRYSLLRGNATKDRSKRGKSENVLGNLSLPRDIEPPRDKRLSHDELETPSSPSGLGGGSGDEHLAPAIPARLPRMGKASLTTTNVLPIVARTTSNNNISQSPPLPPSRMMDENSNIRRHGTVQETFRSLPVYLDERDPRLQGTGGTRVGTPPPDGPPPIVPRRRPNQPSASSDTNASYDKLQKPTTINQWLLDLGLPKYIPMFYDNGWDELDYINSISESDLIAMMIHNKEHRDRIMKSVQDMSQ